MLCLTTARRRKTTVGKIYGMQPVLHVISVRLNQARRHATGMLWLTMARRTKTNVRQFCTTSAASAVTTFIVALCPIARASLGQLSIAKAALKVDRLCTLRQWQPCQPTPGHERDGVKLQTSKEILDFHLSLVSGIGRRTELPQDIC